VTHEITDDFTVTSDAAGGTTQVVTACGGVGFAEARRIERAVIEGLSLGRTHVVLDLAAVTATGPGLLGVLLRIRRGVTRVDGQLALIVAGPPVSELVATSLLGRLIDVAPDRDTAIRLVSARMPELRGTRTT
jgi:hypothetical protein